MSNISHDLTEIYQNKYLINKDNFVRGGACLAFHSWTQSVQLPKSSKNFLSAFKAREIFSRRWRLFCAFQRGGQRRCYPAFYDTHRFYLCHLKHPNSHPARQRTIKFSMTGGAIQHDKSFLRHPEPQVTPLGGPERSEWMSTSEQLDSGSISNDFNRQANACWMLSVLSMTGRGMAE